jgi:hypothetical protein
MVGLSRQKIAHHIGIDEATLTKHLAAELKEAKAQLLAKSISVIYNGLSSSKEEIRVRCGMYTLDRQGREFGWSPQADAWFERNFYTSLMLYKLTSEEFAEYIRLLEKSGVKFIKPPA